MNIPETIKLEATITQNQSGHRLDAAAADLFPQFSRARLQKWIKAGQLTLNHQVSQPKSKVYLDDQLHIHAELSEELSFAPEYIPLDIIHEDEALLIINKPVGLVVHPAPGNYQGTLLNALLHYCPQLSTVPRAGIVHRLDKDTSGVMMVAKTLESHCYLVNQLQQRFISRDYETLVMGNIIAGATVDAPIARHPSQRTKMAVVESGKPAVTHYRIRHKFSALTQLSVTLETGRTHQIRVHMAHIRHPIVGDKTYGGRLQKSKTMTDEVFTLIQQFPRQALHAKQLSLVHPLDKKTYQWQAPLAEDFAQLLKALHDADD